MGDSLTASAATPPPKPSDPGLTRGSPEGGRPCVVYTWKPRMSPLFSWSQQASPAHHVCGAWCWAGLDAAQRTPSGELPTGARLSRLDLDPAFRPFPLWVSHSTFTLEHRRPGSLEKDPM